ncbi:MAG: hypothetical protein ACK4JY_13525 [Brevundimonas sp.]|uniref:hypothetical protein n=1 Tax=Brevundimonas sp. TaxID=1871086 RepID=UPI00391A56D5
MTPHRSAAPEPRRTKRFNAAIVGLILLLLVGGGVYVWMNWSLRQDDVAAESREHPVQPSELPPPNQDTLSPEGAEQVGAAATE